MRGTTHVLAGLILFVALQRILHFQNEFLGLSVVLLASLLPDIDERHSTLGRRIPVIGFFVKHRTFFHGILFLVLCVVLLSFWIDPVYVVAFSLSFMLHLVLDALTPAGVTPFWPSKLRLKGFVRVGGLLEKTIFLLFIIVFIYLLLG